MYKIICISMIELDQDAYAISSHKTFRKAKHALCDLLKKERKFWKPMQGELADIRMKNRNGIVYASYEIDHLDRDYCYFIVNDDIYACDQEHIWDTARIASYLAFGKPEQTCDEYNLDAIPEIPF